MHRYLFFLIMLCGCSHHRSTGVLEDNIAAIMPVYNSSSQDMPWNVSEELTGLLCQFGCRDTVCLINPYGTAMTFDDAYNRPSQLAPWADYVILANLLDHGVHSQERLLSSEAERCPSALLMKVRLVVFDCRSCIPSLLLDQTISSSYTIPAKYEFWNYTKTQPGCGSYVETPLCQAHERLAKIMMDKVQESIYDRTKY